MSSSDSGVRRWRSGFMLVCYFVLPALLVLLSAILAWAVGRWNLLDRLHRAEQEIKRLESRAMTADVSADSGALLEPVDRIPMLVLGDSDSHAYHDRILISDDRRGGNAYRGVTFQWTEILDRLRADRLDLGSWGEWGTRYRYAMLRRALGQEARLPRKEDYEYVLAISGARCEDLSAGPGSQLRHALDIIAREPERWARGVVVIKIGVNSIQKLPELNEYAQTGLDETARRRLTEAFLPVESAVHKIRNQQPGIAIVLVGLFDETNIIPEAPPWTSAAEYRNIRSVFDAYDDKLKQLAEGDPRTIFVNDRTWWQASWGGRDDEGRPHYRAVNLGGPKSIEYTSGDHPLNAILADGHGGTVHNGLFAAHLIREINDAFGMGISPPLPIEIADLADPTGAYGIAPPQRAPEMPIVIQPPDVPRTLPLRKLPYTLPPVTAYLAEGTDISDSAVAFAVAENGEVRWLYGDGSRLQLRSDRHTAGAYRVYIRVRTRSGAVATTHFDCTLVAGDSENSDGK